MLRALLADLMLLVLVLTLAAIAYHRQMFLRPMGIHTWGQADRLAIAYQLHDHENNPLINRTWTSYTKENRVGVEFPLQAWLAATAGRILGREAIPPLMRFITLLPVLAGLWLMAVFIRGKTGSAIPASVFIVFFFGAPVAVCYAASFLIDGFVLGLVLCGSYFLFRYWETLRYSDFLWAMGFLYTAAVCKASAFWFVPAGLSVFWLWWHNKGKISFKKIFVPQAVGFALVVLDIVRVKYDTNRFESGGLFLAKAMPITSKEQLESVVESISVLWWWQYLVPVAYFALFFISAVALVFVRPRHLKGHRLVWLVASLVLLAAFVGAFGRQLQHHDYYLLASAYPLLFFALAFFLVRIWKRLPLAVYVFGAAAAVASAQGIRQNYARHREVFFGWPDRTHLFEGAAKYFPPSERYQDKLLVLWEVEPNMVLQFAEKPGYHMNMNMMYEDSVIQMLAKDPSIRYAIYANEVEDEVREKTGGALDSFRLHAREEKFTILKRW